MHLKGVKSKRIRATTKKWKRKEKRRRRRRRAVHFEHSFSSSKAAEPLGQSSISRCERRQWMYQEEK